MEDIDGGLHPAVDGQSLDDEDEIALAATNVFEILTILLMPVRTQFTNPS